MSCNQPDKPANPALSQENNKNLQALIAAREAQDKKFDYTQKSGNTSTNGNKK